MRAIKSEVRHKLWHRDFVFFIETWGESARAQWDKLPPWDMCQKVVRDGVYSNLGFLLLKEVSAKASGWNSGVMVGVREYLEENV